MRLLRIAALGVFGHLPRSILSIVALALAVIGIVTITAAGLSVERLVTARAILANGPATTIAVSGFSGGLGAIHAADLRKYFSSYTGAKGIAVLTESLASTAFDVPSGTENIPITFTESELIRVRPFQIISGNWIVDRKSSNLIVPVVLNRSAGDLTRASVGISFSIRVPGVSTSTRALVVGLIEDGFAEPHAYAPIENASLLLVGNDTARSSSLLVSGSDLSTREVEQRLNSWRSLTGISAPATVERRDTVDELRRELDGTRSVFVIVAILGLISGGLGIANVTLSSSRERSDEMSLRRALGARRWHVPMILILESQIVAFLAIGLAIVVSFVLYPWIGSTFGAPYGTPLPPYPWWAAVLGAFIGSGTAILAAMIPAVRSWRTSMSTVLRA